MLLYPKAILYVDPTERGANLAAAIEPYLCYRINKMH